jgi:antitoxin component YwqK of YwqJK toxin-antitoxin module
MRSILLGLLFLLIPKMVFSQVSETNELVLSINDKFIYLDSTNTETKSKDYAYIRVIKDSKLKQESYAVQEYYRSGVLRMEGTSKTSNGNSHEGEVTYYYKNGTKKSIANYGKGHAIGKDYQWYENGSKKLEGEYIEDEKKKTSQHKINQFWDLNGVQKIVDGNGFFENKDENESEKGEIKNGFKEGVWEGLFFKLKYLYKETYTNGKLISGRSWDKNNNTYIYTEIMVKPVPRNGMMDFYKYIQKNYEIPKMLPPNTKGKIYVTFVVDKEGKIVEPRILRDLGYGTGQEALRILPYYDGFSPAEERGQKVRCTFSLPITIQSAN